MSFPLDFGFIPSTLCDDGDPLDVMVLVDEPTCVGALLEVRLIGVIAAKEVEKGREERNDRLLAITTVSRLYAEIKAAQDLPAAFIDGLNQFWIEKDRLEGKAFTVLGVGGPEDAVERVRKCARTFKKAA